MPVRETAGSISAGAYRVDFNVQGGAITRFDWNGEPLFRASVGPSPFDQACFPLVPFSNRIAGGRFVFRGRQVSLQPNFPGADHPHALHGLGWLATWRLDEMTATDCVMTFDHPAGEWPWAFQSIQRLRLTEAGLEHELSVRNLSTDPMPAGLGFHPYLMRDEDTRYVGLHHGEWLTTPDGLPTELVTTPVARDWWEGRSLAHKVADTVYTDRAGDLLVRWPERDLGLTIHPSPMLKHTVIYSPAGQSFFCIEPVSHSTNALNTSRLGEMAVLGLNEVAAASVLYSAR